MKFPWLAALLLGYTLVGCESTGVGNPRSELTVSATNDLQAEPDAGDPTVQLDRSNLRNAIIVLGELRWLPCDAADQRVIVPGPFVVNLETKQVEPAMPPVLVPNQGFCGFDAPLSTQAADASMQGRSILFSGVRSDGTLFIFYSAMQGKLRMRSTQGVAWQPNNAGHMLWALRPNRWLSLEELDNETSDAFGASRRAIVVDVDRHRLLYELVRERISERSSLYEDSNLNGRIDDAERATLLGSGLPGLD